MKMLAIAAMFVLAGCGGAEDSTSDDLPRGITADSITIGSHTDLSGGLAIWGVPANNGQRMRYEEANAAGGIHGRRIDFIVEDSQYQMPVAVKATNKLLNVNNIFLSIRLETIRNAPHSSQQKLALEFARLVGIV